MIETRRHDGIREGARENLFGSRESRRLLPTRALLLIAALLLTAVVPIDARFARGAPIISPSGVAAIHGLRPGAAQASVVGTSDTPSAAIDVLVNSVVVSSGTTSSISDFGFLVGP